MAHSSGIATTAAQPAAADPKAVAYLTRRGIGLKIANRMRVHTGRRRHDGDVTPDQAGDVLCFPYFLDGKMVNCKYQGADKRRWAIKGAPLVFYGIDLARELHRQYPDAPLVITEGEVDCLTALTAGSIAVSVPNGAPGGNGEVPYDPPEGADDKGFGYLINGNGLDFIGDFAEIVIATDGDEPGIRLREELARRIGRARARFLRYPPGTKDLNEVWQKYGQLAATELLRLAPRFPLRGLHRFADYLDEPPIIGHSTGIDRLDPFLRPHLGSLMVVTGIPAHGKSTFACALAASMARKHGWPVAISSFEMRANRVRQVMVNAIANHPFEPGTESERRIAGEWIDENCVMIDPRDWDVSVTVDWFCRRVVEAVRRYGTRIWIADPWGDFNHPTWRGSITTDYISDAIRKLRRLSAELDMLGLVIAHPVKMGQDADGEYVMPKLYDVSGSAHFHNKTDFGLTVYRSKVLHEAVKINIEKVRYEPETGHRGELILNYNPATGKYY
jgi:twinkle protein